MDGLRWLLLLFGVLVVAGVYLFGRYQKNKPNNEELAPSPNNRVEPSLDGVQVTPAEADAADDSSPMSAGLVPDLPETEQKIVTLRIVARNNGAINGEELVLSLRGIGMRHGKFGIYHRFEGTEDDEIIFSAASLVEPGTFDMATIREQQIPGISLFMVLPGPVDGAKAFDLMMTAARALRQALDAELLDESGSTLSIQRERYLREEIIQFQHSILVA